MIEKGGRVVNPINIQTFLCVAQHHSLSEAAAALYISQPTVTARIQQLETELGVTLLLRQKGVRSIELTPQGTAFLPIAARWAELDAQTEQFSRKSYRMPLRVACPDSLNHYLLLPLYEKLASPEYSLSFRLRTHQSPEIFGLMENREVQIGFVFHLSRSANVRCIPLFSEKTVLLVSRQSDLPAGTLSPEQLDVRQEVFLPWSQDIQIWHNTCFGTSMQPYFQTDCASIVGAFLQEPGCWALCPESVAVQLEREGKPVERRRLSMQPPERVCYLLTQRENESGIEDPACTLFVKELRSFLSGIGYITML